MPNYLWMEAGTNFGVANDRSPLTNSPSTSQHLVTLLKNAPGGGIEWRAYQENISGKERPLSDRYPYAVKHDPFMYFDDVTDRRKPNSAYCIAHVRPYEELSKDLTIPWPPTTSSPPIFATICTTVAVHFAIASPRAIRGWHSISPKF
ncbi:MAG TPA: hypothetical protein VEI52_08640 [Terriglobales bacterium]|nr:hypothetical protein [Terriglobales bacterium]